jgi:capping protein alpha
MSEEAAASPEQKLNIATYFIMSSPTGEVDEVVSDVTKLVSDPSVLTPDALLSILRDYNVEQMISALDLQGKAVLVTKFGQVGPDLYLDPATGKVLRFDHLKRAFLEETDKKQLLPPSVDSYRLALHQAMVAYTAESFKPGKCTVAVYGADNGLLTVAVSARNVNLGNFWTGAWRASYAINCSASGPQELSGALKVTVHYFEDGNVQLHSTADLHTQLIVDTPDALAKRVADAISKFEGDYQGALEEVYVNMHRTTFKAMRRLLPLNRQKFAWNMAAHSLANEVSK